MVVVCSSMDIMPVQHPHEKKLTKHVFFVIISYTMSLYMSSTDDWLSLSDTEHLLYSELVCETLMQGQHLSSQYSYVCF